MLKRYWFRFEPLPYDILSRGCGVTAFDLDDAKSLLDQSIFKDRNWPQIVEVIENVDISTLDRGPCHSQHGTSSLARRLVSERLPSHLIG